MAREPKTHDYTESSWGHAVTIMSIYELGLVLNVAGFGYDVRCGDFLILKNEKATTRYVVISIDYRCDPPDMWFATLQFAPRPKPHETAQEVPTAQQPQA